MTVVAAVDIGTNTTRLLIARGDVSVERRSEVTRLGAGVDRAGSLSGDGVERTLSVLRDFGAAITAAGAQRVRAVATSAVRDADDGPAFLAAAGEALGWPVEGLSGDDEGRLAFAGATASLAPSDGPFLVLDIGGGSTEFVVGTAEVDAVVSIDVGALRLTEQWLHSDPPTAEELSMAISVVRTHLEDVTREAPATKDARTVVGVAGTIVTVAAVELGLTKYDRDRLHHFRLTRAAAEDVFRTLATEPLADRIHNPGLPAARADIIVGGCCVLVAVLRHFDAESILVSETGILDALVASIAS